MISLGTLGTQISSLFLYSIILLLLHSTILFTIALNFEFELLGAGGGGGTSSYNSKNTPWWSVI